MSGDFSQQGLKENLDGLSLKDIQGVSGWVDFYHQQYKYIGKGSHWIYNRVMIPVDVNHYSIKKKNVTHKTEFETERI